MTPLHSLEDWLSWQETISPKSIDLDLSRVSKIFQKLNFVRPNYVITIAGTNGKGSSVAMIEAMMISMGKSVASYTSPHIHKYNERIKINRKAVSDELIIAAFKKIEKIREGLELTYFEYGTLAALQILSDACVEVIVLEVGLGGRLDAVNILDADACIITNISRDHEDWLGTGIENIALEKAGIMRRGKPVIFGSLVIPKNIKNEAFRKKAKLITSPDNYKFNINDNKSWSWFGATNQRMNLSLPNMKGTHQLKNAAAVLALIEAIPEITLPDEVIINKAITTIELSGRIDFRNYAEKKWLFDVAHNVESAHALVKTIKQSQYNKCITVICVLADKDIEGIIKLLVPIVDHWVIVNLNTARASEVRNLQNFISKYSQKEISVGGDASQSMQIADISSQENDLILVTGSFYTVGPSLKWIEKRIDECN